jgi:hypothetical protein
MWLLVESCDFEEPEKGFFLIGKISDINSKLSAIR